MNRTLTILAKILKVFFNVLCNFLNIFFENNCSLCQNSSSPTNFPPLRAGRCNSPAVVPSQNILSSTQPVVITEWHRRAASLRLQNVISVPYYPVWLVGWSGDDQVATGKVSISGVIFYSATKVQDPSTACRYHLKRQVDESYLWFHHLWSGKHFYDWIWLQEKLLSIIIHPRRCC